jgi:hypothetical protein
VPFGLPGQPRLYCETPECKHARRAENSRNRRAANLEAVRAADRRWREANPAAVRRKSRTTTTAGWRSRLKAAVFAHYGAACACCGSTADLQIDHVNGDGKEHREQVGRGTQMYRWLARNGFPPGFQTLCRKCNTSKGAGAACTLNHV